MREIIINLLEDNGYKPFFNEKIKYPADFQDSFKDNAFVFIENNKEKELYLLHNCTLPDCKDEKSYQVQLDSYQEVLNVIIKQIKGFNILYRNQILCYNVNLILLCNFINNPKFQDLTNRFFASFEREACLQKNFYKYL